LISEQKFYGNAYHKTISADWNLPMNYRVLRIAATGVGYKVKLPDATKLRPGGPRFYILNLNTSSYGIADQGGTTLATLAEDEIATVSLVDNATSNGIWAIQIEPITISSPTAPENKYYVAGGYNYGTRLRKYTRAGDAWSQETESAYTRVDAAAWSLNVRAFVTGGSSYNSARCLQEFSQRSWKVRTKPPFPLKQTVTGKWGLTGYVFGSDYETQYRPYYAKYAPTDTWTTIGTDVPNAMYEGCADGPYGTSSNKIFLTRGNDSPVQKIHTMYLADTDTFASKAGYADPARRDLCCFLHGSNYHIACGYDLVTPSVLSQHELFDVSAETWSTQTPCSVAVYKAAAGSTGTTYGYKTAGIGALSQVKDDHEELVGTTWSTKTAFPNAEYALKEAAFAMRDIE
jgi:hypothetical protein